MALEGAAIRPPKPRVDDEHQALTISTTRVLLGSYYEIVRGSLQDMVPKVRYIEQSLIRNLFREER
jgi:hypothetical protein